jgi:chitosanase
MSLAALQKAAAQAIVNIFETGSVRGSYGDVTLLPGDSGQLTYGRSQTTLASGNLFLLIQAYCARSDGQFSAAMKQYLPSLEACDRSLNYDAVFRSLLREAGDDPVMQEVQDNFFDRIYWEPALRSARVLGVVSALGTAIVYDSSVHGSWAHVRDLTRKRFGELFDIGEDEWLQHYVDTRREWLAENANQLLHRTVYRMDAFKHIIEAGNWNLTLPLSVRGLAITPDSLDASVLVSVSADPAPRRVLRLRKTPMTGADVIWLQHRLTTAGFKTTASGAFDSNTDASVRAFQKDRRMTPDGVVGPATRTALEDIPVTAQAKSGAAIEPMPPVAQPPAATVDMTAANQAAQTRPIGGDATADIKRHITTEVHSAVQQIQSTMRGGTVQPTFSVPAGSGSKRSVVHRALQGVPHKLLVNRVLKGHPGWAAGFSALLLILTEARDALAWVQAGPFSGVIPPGIPTNLPVLPKSSADVPSFLRQGADYLHSFAASVPNEWLFRVRIAALVLIGYALYRLLARRVDVTALEQELAQAQLLVTDMQVATK